MFAQEDSNFEDVCGTSELNGVDWECRKQHVTDDNRYAQASGQRNEIRR